jgi:hypothetical protein
MLARLSYCFERSGCSVVDSVSSRSRTWHCVTSLPEPLRLHMRKMDESVLRLFEGEVFTPRYRRLMRLSDGNPDDGRSRLDAERAKLQASVDALVTAIEVGGDIPALVGELKACNDKLGVLDRQIESLPPAPPDRARLRAVLEQRVADWKERLRSDHKEARFGLEQLVRNNPITLWNGRAEDFETADGFEPGDERGKVGLELEDVFGFEARAYLALVEGLDGARYLSMVAGRDLNPK